MGRIAISTHHEVNMRKANKQPVWRQITHGTGQDVGHSMQSTRLSQGKQAFYYYVGAAQADVSAEPCPFPKA